MQGLYLPPSAAWQCHSPISMVSRTVAELVVFRVGSISEALVASLLGVLDSQQQFNGIEQKGCGRQQAEKTISVIFSRI
jgi:hypothetical protein